MLTDVEYIRFSSCCFNKSCTCSKARHVYFYSTFQQQVLAIMHNKLKQYATEEKPQRNKKYAATVNINRPRSNFKKKYCKAKFKRSESWSRSQEFQILQRGACKLHVF